MYRTAERPSPLDFLLPSPHPSYNIDRRKDLGQLHSLSHLAPVYFEAPTREGLRTPPTDDMATAYQNNFSHGYPASGRSSEYLSVESASSSYGGTYNNNAAPAQSRQYMSMTQPPPASASTLRKEVQGPITIKSQPPSPEPTQRTSYLSHEEPLRRKSTTDVIRPSLQIPKSISSNGGSLAEFAAQVGSQNLNLGFHLLTIIDYMPVLVRVHPDHTKGGDRITTIGYS